jgi:hypothetical protein
MLEIPLTSDVSQRFEIELNGFRLFFSVRYNPAAALWTFDLEDSAKPLVYGVTMLIGQNLLHSHRDLTETIGQLWMYDLSGLGIDATAETLGSQVILLFLEPDEAAPIPIIERDITTHINGLITRGF